MAAEETPLDTDGDGLYDQLEISLATDVTFPGNYTWNGRLVDQQGTEICWAIGNDHIDSQDQMVFTFDGQCIHQKGNPGPYTLTDVSIYGEEKTAAGYFRDVYTTAAYGYDQFDPPVSRIQETAVYLPLVIRASEYISAVTGTATPTAEATATPTTEPTATPTTEPTATPTTEPTATPTTEPTATPTTEPTATPTAEPTATPTTEPSEPDESEKNADISVVLRAVPGMQIVRGDILSIEFRVENLGDGAASKTQVHMPYDQSKLSIVDANFEVDDDWISELGDGYVVITFGSVKGGEERTGIVRLRVADTLTNDTAITLRASFDNDDPWSGKPTNVVKVLVGDSNEDSIHTWLDVTPAYGSADTQRNFFSDRFQPNEQVVTWLNLPDGSAKETGSAAIADEEGRIWLDYTCQGCYPGTYQMVVHGLRSKLEGVAPFVVE